MNKRFLTIAAALSMGVALTAKQKLILKQFDMDEKYIDRSIGEFSY